MPTQSYVFGSQFYWMSLPLCVSVCGVGRNVSRMKNRTRCYLHFSIELLIDKFVFGVVTCQLLFARWNWFVNECVCQVAKFGNVYTRIQRHKCEREFHIWQMIGMLISLVAKMYDQILFLKREIFPMRFVISLWFSKCFCSSLRLFCSPSALMLWLFSSSIKLSRTGG